MRAGLRPRLVATTWKLSGVPGTVSASDENPGALGALLRLRQKQRRFGALGGGLGGGFAIARLPLDLAQRREGEHDSHIGDENQNQVGGPSDALLHRPRGGRGRRSGNGDVRQLSVAVAARAVSARCGVGLIAVRRPARTDPMCRERP